MILGHVYVIHTTLAQPPKDKIVVCICAARDLFFWINTKPRRHGIGQLSLAVADHPAALTHPCHLDCARVTTFPQSELSAARDRGRISSAFAQRIVDLLNTTPPKTLTPQQLKTAIQNLSALI